jgi:hypothetical protein
VDEGCRSVCCYGGLCQRIEFSMRDVEALPPGMPTYVEAQRTLVVPSNVSREPDGSLRAGWARSESWDIFSSTRAVIIQFAPDGRLVRVVGRGQAGWTPGN